jgi:precorrin-6B methylase 2
MNRSHSVRRFSAVLVLAFLAAGVLQGQQQDQKQFQPTVGQAGKDVVWVPTPQVLVDKMLDLAKVTPQDFVMDLGSGDGRTVITAAKRGARAMGIEYDPNMVELSKRNAAEAGMTEKVTFMKADLFETDFSKATVITMFLLPEINLKLRPKLLDMKPGTRVVSNSFTMEDWAADETVTAEDGCSNWCTAYLWIIPAKVGGTWHLANGDLILKQEFQMITGTISTGTTKVTVNGKLTGNGIQFTAGNVQYTGRLNGATLSGTAKSGATSNPWSATRVN